ncbi:ABC transporter ATP-binding protein [Anabaena sp. PCC 7108]|uniref:ABC transporter ATP-binding protein n=1 Tax=Anabaena sp. PCC 7108 TaxID=163908 RepID=UPI00034910AB|nr:ABC transporter ATP-binding protein [Anabaena sp. PCC 7108]
MSDTVIRIENLSKKYIIGHQKQERHTALRDVIANQVKSVSSLINRKSKTENPEFEDFWALNDISFEVKQGDRVGIIGRNGAGKSTLLKILSRITEPTQGSIKIKGRVASLLEVGTGFHPELTGRENIFLNGAILGMSRVEIKRKFDEIVDFAEVEKFLDTPVKRYSSGMYVRLAFAVAAHLEPEILIIDEVLAVGDSAFQQKCLGKMEEVGQQGRTVLFVSHNMATVKQLCTRALLLFQGTLVFQGNPTETITKYMQKMTQEEPSSSSIKTYRHIKGDARAEIQKIIVNDINNSDIVVSIFEKIKISIEYKINEPITELDFFVLIYNLDEGEVQASLFQRDFELANHIQPSSDTDRINVEFINPLMPGKYTISAGIFDKNKRFVDWVEFAESFYVEPAFINGNKYDQRLGKMSIQGTWYAE